eukprot:5846823-Amphidinium_carterae.1
MSWCTEYTESQLCRWNSSGRRGWMALASSFPICSLGGPCPSHDSHRPASELVTLFLSTYDRNR